VRPRLEAERDGQGSSEARYSGTVLSSVVVVVAVVVVLFGAMLACVEAGYVIGRRRADRDPGGAFVSSGAVEGAVFGLLGLLLAFTFAGAASRFDMRRSLVVEEANDIGTAWLRLDLLRAEDQPALRDLFRRYVEARIAVYEKMPDFASVRAEIGKANALQAQIWTRAVDGCRRAGGGEATLLLLPALNAMIDITTTRTRAAIAHIPLPILGALFAVALLAAIVAGQAMATTANRNLLQGALFAAAVALTIYVILDYEYPRVGLIRLDHADEVMIELRESLR
jgi:hypothetical protein